MIVSFPNLTSHYSRATQVSIALPKTWSEVAPTHDDAVRYTSEDGGFALSIGVMAPSDAPFVAATPPAYTDGFPTSVIETGRMDNGLAAAQVWVQTGPARYRFRMTGTDAQAVPALLVQILGLARFVSDAALPDTLVLDRPQTTSFVHWGWLSLSAPSGTRVRPIPNNARVLALPPEMGGAELGLRLEKADNLPYERFLTEVAAKYTEPDEAPPGYRVLECGPMAIDRRPAVGVTYEMDLPRGERVAIVEACVWLDATTILRLTGRCPEMVFTKAGPALGAIIGGMRVLKEDGALRRR